MAAYDRDYYSMWRWPFVVLRRSWHEWLWPRRFVREIRAIARDADRMR